MNTSIFTTIRFVLALFTVITIIGHPHVPPKTRQLLPDEGTKSHIFGPPDVEGGKSVSWVNNANNKWRCDYKPQFGPVNCGVAMVWEQPDQKGEHRCDFAALTENNPVSMPIPPEMPDAIPVGEHLSSFPQSDPINDSVTRESDCARAGAVGRSLDFSQYDGLRVRIHYEGRARVLRLYMRNHHPEYVGKKQFVDGKFMSAIIRTDELRAGKIYVDLEEFSVDERWVTEANVNRHQALPEFSHVTALGVDLIEHGIHKVRVDEIELVGEHFTTAEFLRLILIFWGGMLLLEGTVRYYWFYRTSILLKPDGEGAV